MTKGMLRNNYYMVHTSVKATIGIALLILIAVLAVTIIFPENTSLINYASFAVMGSFAGIPFTLLYNDNLSKWNRFALTTPVVKNDIIKARYITFLISTIVALMAMFIMLISYYMVRGSFDLERLGYSLTFGFVFLILISGFMHPLILKFGIEKGQIIFLISVAITLAVHIAPTILLNMLNLEISNLTYRVGIVLISSVGFIISYRISKKIYNQKDI